jgi:hypothetical protein
MEKISERYSIARNTSNLKSEPRTVMSASDVIGAAGMAAQEHQDALLLWSVMYGGKTSQKMRLVDGLAYKLTDYMMRNRLKGNPRHIAMEVLAYYLHATCDDCDGVGHQIIPYTIVRSDDPCPYCQGTGKPPMPQDEAWQWLHDRVSELLSIAAGKTMQKIDLSID